ncbi:MAG TPA: RDD family protein [Cellulomonas sp.]
MVDRRDVGSWLEGPAAEPAAGAGLPESGAGSVARFGPRLVALAVDWVACLLVSSVFFRDPGAALPVVGGYPWATLAIFVVENVVLVGTLGHTLGHRLLGLRVRRFVVRPDGQALPDDGRAPGLGRAAVRTVLLCLVVPAAVQDGLGRGLHDRSAGTAIVRR